MNKEKLIKEFIDNCITISKMVYENEIIDYKVSNKLTDKNVALYAKLIGMNAKDELEKLLDHENKYVRSFIATIFLNGGDHEKALKVKEEISKNNDKYGRATKDYIKRIKDGKIDREDWNRYIDKLKGKTTKEQEDIIEEININNQQEFELPIFSNNKAEEINSHFKNGYPGCEVVTFKDENPVNKHLAIDINILTVKENPFYTVYTTGMSNFVMSVPKTLFGKYNRFKFAELVILIPLEWGNDFSTNNWKALFKLLRELAVYPHLNNTWINDSHTLEINMDKLNPNFKAVLLCGIEIMGKPLKVNNDNVVLNMVVPIYKEELEYIFKNNYYKLLDEISKEQESPFLLKLDRKCSVK